MHESTVSRVTTNKYVHTPQGIFELKFFFNSGISRTNGDDLASEAVKPKIKQLVAREDAKHPHSDQKIVELLATRTSTSRAAPSRSTASSSASCRAASAVRYFDVRYFEGAGRALELARRGSNVRSNPRRSSGAPMEADGNTYVYLFVDVKIG